MIQRFLYLIILLVISAAQISVAELEDEWEKVERYLVTDFDKEGKNLYIDNRGFFYVDKIDISNKELIIEYLKKNSILA